MPIAKLAPFRALTPQRVIAALERLGLRCDGRILALNSYENRVFRVGIEDQRPLVAKFYRPGRWSDAAILEEHAFARELLDAEVPVAAPLLIGEQSLHHLDGWRVTLFAIHAGRAPECGDRDTLRQIGRVLGRLHSIGARQPFTHRGRLGIERFGDAAVDAILASRLLPRPLEEKFLDVADALLDEVDARWIETRDMRWLRVHGDCHLGNLLWRDEGLTLVDLDDALTAPAVTDLWMLISGSPAERSQQLEWLLEGYTVFREFDHREFELIGPLQALRLLHFNGWVAARWDDPAFPAAFPGFDESQHWERVLVQVQEQLAALGSSG